MLVKNLSARLYHVGGVMISPLDTVEVPDSAANDIKDNADLEVVKKQQVAKEAKE